MVRGPCIDKNTGVKKGAWSEEEDTKLRAYVQRYGHWNWRQLPKFADLNRCGKSCRLRWMNYLKPGVRRGNYTPQEEGLIRELHAQYGNKWSVIAAKLPGRTDNDIKNHWHSHLMGMKAKADHSKSKDPEETKFNLNEDESSTLDEESSSSSVSTFRSMELRIYL